MSTYGRNAGTPLQKLMRRSSSVMNVLPVRRSTVIFMHCQLNLDVGGRKSISHGATEARVRAIVQVFLIH